MLDGRLRTLLRISYFICTLLINVGISVRLLRNTNWFKPPVNLWFTDRSKAETPTFIDTHFIIHVICLSVLCLFSVSCLL